MPLLFFVCMVLYGFCLKFVNFVGKYRLIVEWAVPAARSKGQKAY